LYVIFRLYRPKNHIQTFKRGVELVRGACDLALAESLRLLLNPPDTFVALCGSYEALPPRTTVSSAGGIVG